MCSSILRLPEYNETTPMYWENRDFHFSKNESIFTVPNVQKGQDIDLKKPRLPSSPPACSTDTRRLGPMSVP